MIIKNISFRRFPIFVLIFCSLMSLGADDRGNDMLLKRIDFSNQHSELCTALNASSKVEGDAFVLDGSPPLKSVWRRCLSLNAKKIGMRPGRVYSVEFNYEVLKKPIFFHLLERGSKGWRELKRWNDPEGVKSAIRVVYTSDMSRTSPLVFGMKGDGKLKISDLVIKEWKSEKEAKSVPVIIDFSADGKPFYHINEEDVVVKDGRLIADTTKHKHRVWHRCLFLDPAKIGLEKNTVYSVEFDYEVLKSPSYFQLMERGPKWRLLLNWSGPKGFKSHASVIFRTNSERARQLMFGMKNPGAIALDNIVIRRWDSKKEAQKGLKALKVDINSIRKKKELIEKEISQHDIDSFGLREILTDLARLFKKSKFDVNDRLRVCDLSKQLDLKVFKMKAAKNARSINGAFAVTTACPLVKIRCDAPCELNYEAAEVKLSAAGNEFESFQLLVIPFKTVRNFHIETADLKSKNGEVLSKHTFSCRKVEYVDTKKELYPVEYAGLWPDPLPLFNNCDIPNSTYVQPFWVTAHIPNGTPSGVYRGKFLLKCVGAKDVVVPVSIRVRNFSLPLRPTFRTAFGVGGSAAYYKKHGIIGDNPTIYAKVNDMYRDALLDYKISPTKIAPPPPFSNGYVKSLIKTQNGVYKADTSNFDVNLTHCLAKGLNGFSFGTYWGWRNHQKGVSQKINIVSEDGKLIEQLDVKVGSPEFNALMGAYFKSWESYLRKRGCLDMAYYYIYDEPAPKEVERVNQLLKVVSSNAPEIKTVIPGIPVKGEASTFPDLGIMCPLLSNIDFDLAKRLSKLGKESWWYVCMTPRHPYPNLFIDYPAIDHRVLFWMAWKYDVSGMLYWQTTYWNRANPWNNPETYPTTHGDGCLFYPSRGYPIEVVPSIRLEVLRDGVEDYEYFAILRRLTRELKGTIPAELALQAKKALIVPETIVKSTESYSLNVLRLLAKRAEIGDVIEKLMKYVKRDQVRIEK